MLGAFTDIFIVLVMNDCWKSKSEDDIKIYFSEDKESNRRFLFRAKLEVTGEISYEFSLDELGDVDVSKLEYYPGGYSGFYSSDSDPTIIEQSLVIIILFMYQNLSK